MKIATFATSKFAKVTLHFGEAVGCNAQNNPSLAVSHGRFKH